MKKLNENYEICHIEDGRPNQEKLIKVNLVGVIYKLSIYSRDEVKSVYESCNKSEIMLMTILLCNKLFSRVENNVTILRELRAEAKLMNVNKIENILNGEIDEALYGLNVKKNNAICIVSQEDKYGVFYYSETMNLAIIENVSFSRGIVVMRNYALLLAEFIESYKQVAIELDSKNENYDILLRVYLTAY